MQEPAHQLSFGTCNYQELTKHASTFFKFINNPETTLEQHENGLKALTIFYLGFEPANDIEEYAAQIIIELAARKVVEKEAATYSNKL